MSKEFIRILERHEESTTIPDHLAPICKIAREEVKLLGMEKGYDAVIDVAIVPVVNPAFDVTDELAQRINSRVKRDAITPEDLWKSRGSADC